MIKNGLRLGFNTSQHFRKLGIRQSLALFRSLGLQAVELMQSQELAEYLPEASPDDFADFEYVSVHGATIADSERPARISEIKALNEVRRLDLVVFHPDRIEDFDLLRASGLPIGLENSDHRKKSFRFAAEMAAVLKKYPEFRMVLDLNHIYANDPSMQLAGEFIQAAGERVAEIHLSGFDPATLHAPLFKTKQAQIIRALPAASPVIIVESPVQPGEAVKELEYIRETYK